MKRNFLLTLLLTLLPFVGWAQDPQDPGQTVIDLDPSDPVAKIVETEKNYASLQAAIDEVANDQTIVLLTNIAYTTETVALGGSDANGLSTPASYTIDLAGNNISFSAYPAHASAITLGRSNLAVTITNSAAAGGLISGENTGDPDPMIRVGNDDVEGSSLTIESGVTVTNEKAATILVVSSSTATKLNVLDVKGTVICNSFWDFAVGTNGANKGGIINVFDDAVVTGSGEGIYQEEEVQGGIAIYIPAGECNIKGGTITGYNAGVGVKSGVLNISGGTIICEAPKGDYPWEWNANGVNGVGHAVQVEIGDYPGGDPQVSITGGKFVSKNNAVGSYFKENSADSPLGKFIVGGNFTDNNLDAFLADGYEAVLNNDGVTYDVETEDKTLVQVVPQSGITMEYHGAIDLSNPDVVSLTPLQLNAIEGLREAILTKLQVNNAEALATREQLGATQYSLGLIDENDKKVTFNNQTYTIMPLSSADVVIIPAKNKFNKDANDELLLPALAENLEYTSEAQTLVVAPTNAQTAFPGVEFVVADTEVMPETGWAAYNADANKRTNVGIYYVWARPAADATDGKYEAGDAVALGPVAIAQATPALAGVMALTNAGTAIPVDGNEKIAGNYTCTYAPNLVITASGVTADPTFANGSVKYYYAKQNGQTWGEKTAFVVDNPETENVNEATTFGAGTYKITAEIAADESAYGNWAAATNEAYTITLTVNKANAFTAENAPAGRELTYNGTAQELVTVGESVPAGVIEYHMRQQAGTNQWGNPTWSYWSNWSQDIPEATNANTYQIEYRIRNNQNYNSVQATTVTSTIKKSLLAIKVNNVTKVYDATNSVTKDNTETVDEGGDRFTLLNETFNEDAAQILGVNYAPMAEGTGITVAGSPYEITVTKEALTARNANYDYEVIPGTLTITPAEIYVQTQRYPVLPNGNNNYGIDRYTTTYGVPADFSQAYTVHGLQGDDTAEDVFETLPVLTAPNALPAENPEVGEYDFVFTPGVLNNTNYVLDEEEPYRVWTNGTMTDHFTVQAVGDSRIVITIVPQTAVYNYGAAPEIPWVAGTNYYVTGLQGDDEISTVFAGGALPTFNIKKYADSEEVDIESYDAGTYALEYAGGLELANPTRYAGGIQFINATLTIEPRPLTGVVESQTILLDGEIDEEAFEIKDGETVVDPEELELKAELAENADASINGPGVYDNGLILTIDNPNFVLEEDTEYGQLTILSLTDIVLNPDETAASTIEVAATAVDDDDDPVEFKVTLGEDFPVMKAGEWYTMVLPFEVNTLDLVTKLQTYVIVNRLGASTTDHISFVLESDAIPAGEPFVIKCNKEATFAGKQFTGVTITDEVEDYSDPKYSDNALVGVYAATDIQSTDDQMLAWLGNSTIVKTEDPLVYRQNKWYEPYSAPKTIAPFEAYLKYAPGKTAAGVRMITFEEADGTITAINGVEGENGANAEGLYRIDGVKVQGTTTQKGVYIQDGKKFVK